MINKYPDKVLKILQVIFFSSIILYFGKGLFIPMSYGLLIAIVLYPLCKWLENHSWPRSLAIAAGLFIILILFGLLIFLLIFQVNEFRKDLPELMIKLKPSVLQLQTWLESGLGIPRTTIDKWWQQFDDQLLNNVGILAQGALVSTAGSFITLFLVPVFAALFLYNRQVFVMSLINATGIRNKKLLLQKLNEVIDTYFHFIKGTALVYIIVGVLNSIGLLVLDINHAILFGMLTAVMTIIPYIGIIISAALPISIALITKDSVWYAVGVVGVFSIVQYLEANLIFPKVVARQLNISTMATLVAIIAGGILWGVSGMILFIPFIGIAKIAVDLFPEWKSVKMLIER